MDKQKREHHKNLRAAADQLTTNAKINGLDRVRMIDEEDWNARMLANAADLRHRKLSNMKFYVTN